MAFPRWAIVPALVLSAAAGPASADSYPIEFKVGSGADAAFMADADLQGRFRELETGLRLALEARPNVAGVDPLAPVTPGLFSRESLGFSAAWSPAGPARLDLSVKDDLAQTWSYLSPIVVGAHQINTDSRDASLGVTFKPLAEVDLSLVGASAQTSVQDALVGQIVPRTPSLFTTATQSATAGLQWRPFSWLNFDVKGRMEASAAQWRGGGAAASVADASVNYAYVEPALTGAVTMPWDAALDLIFERAVSPMNAQLFSTFAAVADRSAGARFGPDREWRYRLQFKQKLAGGARLDATLTQARIENATELGPVGGGLQAPMSVSGGDRQAVEVTLSAPLTMLGLPSLTLQGAGAWRSAQVRDPFTGVLRQPSAEVPRAASLGLVQALADRRARWGVEGRFGGGQDLYQMSQVTQVEVADSIAGFVEYVPGPFALRLQVDGLYGGDRSYTDFFYSAPRGTGYVDRIDHRSDSGQAVRLILRKSL